MMSDQTPENTPEQLESQRSGEVNPFRPRRIRIIESGWEGFTGDFGVTAFVAGVSVDLVPWIEQQRLGGLLRIESAESDEIEAQLGPSAELVRGRALAADDERVAAVNTGVAGVNGEMRLAIERFTREDLEDIADRKGINGLRDVAKAWGVKGRSIAELIHEILEAQEAANAGAVPDSATSREVN
jgi:hypothetical protein